MNVLVAKQNAKQLNGSLEMRKIKESFGSNSRKLNKISYQTFHESPPLLDFVCLLLNLADCVKQAPKTKGLFLSPFISTWRF